ncbi:sensor histidine kinase [Anaeromicropila populeti]|uniref:histidine kinase n=1 Tax=Anaeromicropila populeti TaxID=37658 RepID=A0A1I6HQ06_9FIRM|nr:ATP-binding protein [Anaeromicropila populeti]SFR56543.1 Signal transduction histidine kinase [Anaeromicropila populeti]
MKKVKRVKDNLPIRFYNRLFFRIFSYFAVVVSLFAVLLGFIYMKLYESGTMETYRDDLIRQAERIAFQVSDFSATEQQNEFIAYEDALYTVEDPELTDVWILANPNVQTPLADTFTNIKLSNVTLMPEYNEILNKAFSGKTAYNAGNDDVYGRLMVRVAVPVMDAGGNVAGAVMILSVMEGQKKVINRSQSLIWISSVVALIISVIVSTVFARQISGPISEMRKTALTLADGNYDIKTGLVKHGEIGQLAGAIDILSDRLKENEAERKNIEQMRLDFFANVSHELRTPITVMRGYTEMLVDDVITDEAKKRKYYERMLLECKSMERLVGDLLILSKMQNPDFVIDAEPVNLVQVFEDIIRSARVIARKKNISIKMKQDTECAMMHGDYDRLRQMFMIIIDNAIKFSKENGEILIEIESKELLRIRITDKGIGISGEELPFIFEKFYKSKLRQNAQGSGLGLVIAKQIAIKHGGTVDVESEVGIGTMFEFAFDKIELEMI